jgi:hypothetical protein
LNPKYQQDSSGHFTSETANSANDRGFENGPPVTSLLKQRIPEMIAILATWRQVGTEGFSQMEAEGPGVRVGHFSL